MQALWPGGFEARRGPEKTSLGPHFALINRAETTAEKRNEDRAGSSADDGRRWRRRPRFADRHPLMAGRVQG